MKKLIVGVLMGGRSAEHEVSLQSAKNVIAALDPKRFHAVEILVQKSGVCTYSGEPVTFAPGYGGTLFSLKTGKVLKKIDVVFPVLHGPFGEDGTMQGLLSLAGVPYVGADVLGSAVGMNKEVAKRLLDQAGIAQTRYLTATRGQIPTYEQARRKLGTTLFIKPANLGSSVGVSRAATAKEYRAAITEALRFDDTLIIEEAVIGAREIECSVLGNERPRASVPGEITPHHSFYSYEAKYLDPDGAGLIIPAPVSAQQKKDIQQTALRVFQVLNCSGLARVDFFLTRRGKLLVNEINTIPGFTAISMYPKLWAASGLKQPELIARLLELALERATARARLQTSYKLEK